MPRGRKTSSYRGELLQNIKLADPSTWTDREYREIELTIQRRLPLLFEHFGITENDPDYWQHLALALARNHVPGFQAVQKGGAPNKESIYLLCRLYRHFNRTKAGRIRRVSSRMPTATDICLSLTRCEEFKRAFPELETVSAKRLQNLVSKARGLRRERVAAALRYYARKRSLGSDWPGDFAFAYYLPDWIYEAPSSLFLKYNKDQNSYRK